MKREKWQKWYYKETDSPGSNDKAYGYPQGVDYRHPTCLYKGQILPDWSNLYTMKWMHKCIRDK